jgi:hypothetical protein
VELDYEEMQVQNVNLMFVDPCIIVQFLQKNPNKMQECIKILLFLVLNEAQHVSGDTTPIIRSLKLHKQPLVLHNTVEGCRTCSCTSDNLPRYYVTQRLFVQF